MASRRAGRRVVVAESGKVPASALSAAALLKNSGQTPRPPSRGGAGPAETAQVTDISYWIDRPRGHGILDLSKPGNLPELIPPSEIPERYHIVEEQVVRPDSRAYRAEYSDEARKWMVVAFPSLLPAGRKDVMLLERCYHKMLEDMGAAAGAHKDLGESLAARKDVINICFEEIVRQVSVQCLERGRLLELLWQHLSDVCTNQENEWRRLEEELRKNLEDLTEEYKRAVASFGDMSNKYANEVSGLQFALDKMTSENDELKAQLRLLMAKIDELERWREAYNRLEEQEAKERELLIRLHEYVRLMREANGEPDPAAAAGDFGPGTDGAVSASHLKAWKRDVDYVKTVLHRTQAKMTGEAREREMLEHQVDRLEQENASLRRQLDEMRRSMQALGPVPKATEYDDIGVQTDDLDDLESNLTTMSLPVIDDVESGDDGAGKSDGDNEVVVEPSKDDETPPEALGVLRMSFSRRKKKAMSNAWAPLLCKVRKGSAVLTLRSVHRLISSIIVEKLNADEVDDRENNMRQSMAEFVYDYFINKYGLRSLAEQQLANFLVSLRRHREKSSKVLCFAGFSQATTMPFPRQTCDFYLYVFQHLVYSTVGPSFAETEQGVTWISLKRALDACTKVFHYLEPERLREIQGETQQMAQAQPCDLKVLVVMKSAKETTPAGPLSTRPVETLQMRPGPTVAKGSDETVINMDDWLMLAIRHWSDFSPRALLFCEGLFKAADRNDDGLLQMTEFETVIRYIDPYATDHQIEKIYNFALRQGNCAEHITYEAFLEVARTHRLHMTFQLESLPYDLAEPGAAFAFFEQLLVSEETDLRYETSLKLARTGKMFKLLQELEVRKKKLFDLLKGRKEVDAAWIAFKLFNGVMALIRRPKQGAARTILKIPSMVNAAAVGGEGYIGGS